MVNSVQYNSRISVSLCCVAARPTSRRNHQDASANGQVSEPRHPAGHDKVCFPTEQIPVLINVMNTHF